MFEEIEESFFLSRKGYFQKGWFWFEASVTVGAVCRSGLCQEFPIHRFQLKLLQDFGELAGINSWKQQTKNKMYEHGRKNI